MLHFRYFAGFWICFDFRIYQSSEYARFLNMSGLHQVLNKIFREYALDSEYGTVLNMPGSHRFVNKIFHHKYLTGFWICFDSENTSVTQDSVEISLSYMFDRFLSIPWALNLPGLEYPRVVNMPRLQMVLRKLDFKDF